MNVFDIEFLNSLKDESKELSLICEDMCKELIENYEEDEFEIETSSAYHRKVIHIVAKKYGLDSVRKFKLKLFFTSFTNNHNH